jgi:putative ABC transport system permease protein
MERVWFWLRWAARDLRARWPQVAAIALIIAIGTGMSAGLGSMTAWRQRSLDESYALLHNHDLRVELTEGSAVLRGTLIRVANGVDGVAAAEERVIAPTQVDASQGGSTVLVPGRLVGVDVSGGGPHVDGLFVTRGRSLERRDVGTPAAVLEAHFADHYDLPARGWIGLPGGTHIPYVGVAYTPEYFMVTTESGGLLAEANFAVALVPLRVAQDLIGAPSLVNDLVVRLEPGVDRAAARSELTQALHAALPSLAATVSTIDEDPAWRGLYGDLRGDQRWFNTIAVLIFGAAVFAAFNLTSRVVEAKRREFGVGMALGQARWSIALRPMLMGFEIALLGVILGVGVGLIVAEGLRSVLLGLQPLPVFLTTFQIGEFRRAALIGLALPVLATLWPVMRAIRVDPVDAIRTGHLAAKGGGLAPLLKRLTALGSSLAVMPFRNVLRASRRTLLTAIGIGASITAMVGLIGAIDSYNATIDRGAVEIRTGAADRLTVELAGPLPVSDGPVPAIEAMADVRAAVPSLRVGGTLIAGKAAPRIQVVLEILDLENPVWRPTVADAVGAGGLPGIVLAEKAAVDLGLGPGDVVTVRHPVRRAGRTAFGALDEPMRIVGVHPYPIRSFAYLDPSVAPRFGLAGMVNTVNVEPEPGADLGELKRALFELPGVASAQPADATIVVLQDLMAQFTDILRFAELFVLLLALLIAYNAAAISVDERAREYATMFAFGVEPRAVLREITVEGLIVGFIGTVAGIGLGVLAVRWLVSTAATEFPDLGIVIAVAPTTIATALALGVLAVGVAPLFVYRRVRRMDVPSTLRVME